MLSIKEYMKNVNVTKKKYVLNWINQGLIPGVQKTEDGTYMFPDSARRPYSPRYKRKAIPDAKTIRASIVNACIKRYYISASIFHLSESEFNSYITDLIKVGLINRREDDGIVYYDSTAESDKLKGSGVKEIAKKVHEYIVAVGPILSFAASTFTITDILL